MHDYGVSKVYMWLVVEEARAHKSVMTLEMVFGVVVTKVGASRVAVNIEVALAVATPDTLEAHVNCL